MALRLGMTVEQMLASLDSAELTEWVAYLQLERDQSSGRRAPMSDEEALKRAFNCG